MENDCAHCRGLMRADRVKPISQSVLRELSVYQLSGGPRRVRAPLLLTLMLLMAASACKGSSSVNNANVAGTNENSNQPAGQFSSTPPFPTREPERYQATVIVKSSLSEQSSVGQSNQTETQTFVARDKERRREDYELTPGVRVIELETPAGHFLLFPSKKLYAELRPDESYRGADSPAGMAEDFSPDRLNDESPAEARYERLGTEQIGGRTLTKYHVTSKARPGADASAARESLIWVDEALGMPVRSEMVLKSKGSEIARHTMEMSEIK